MNNSTRKSGLITFIAIAVAAIGYLVYHYAYLVYQEYDYYTYYENIHGLQRSCPVYVDGVRVGEVSGILMNRGDKVKVTMSIDKHTKIPKGSIALLASSGLLGDKMILLEKSDSDSYYMHNDFITGRYDTSILEMSDQINPIIESAKYILETADKNFNNFNRKLDNGLVKKTQKDAKRLERNMNKYNKQVADIKRSADEIATSLTRLKHKTAEIVADKDSLNYTLENAETGTANLTQQDYAASTNEFRATINQAREEATTIENSEAIKTLLEDNGTYQNASKQAKELDTELKATKENPPGIQIIGD